MDSLYNWNDSTKIGVGLTALGIMFSILGVVMFLDRFMLTIGNVLFVSGVALVMGPVRFRKFFTYRWRASLCFFTGMLLVLFGWCLIGIMIQGFGTLNLFGNFFPMIVRVLESMPIIGPVVSSAIIQKIIALAHINNYRRRNVESDDSR